MILGTGLKNHNEFFTDLYLSEAINQDIKAILASWAEQKSEGRIQKTPWEEIRSFREQFFRLKDAVSKHADHGFLKSQQDFIADIIRASGYTYERKVYTCDQDLCLPSICMVNGADGAPKILILEALYAEDINPQDMSILSYSILTEQYDKEVQDDRRFSSTVSYDEIISKYIFGGEEPPRWILLVGAETIIMIDRSKWPEKRMLEFDLAEIYDMKADELFKILAIMIARENLAPIQGESLVDSMNENSHQHAYEVSEDLKYAVRECVELLGNEVLSQYRIKGIKSLPSADELSIQTLRWMYRLLFLFYVEARPELEYIPLDNELYMKGYSLESLREIAEGPDPDADGEGTYLHESLQLLFNFVQKGVGSKQEHKKDEQPQEEIQELFAIDSLQSHLFDPKNTKDIDKVPLRNVAVFKIIQNLSLTKTKNRRRRGRVSYSHLGINQLGSVYEGLLSYRGFYAEEDLYEVKKKGEAEDPLEQAFFVTFDELEEYEDTERVYQDDGTLKRYPAGTYIYRLAGRDREKSASYYTPHVLTECLVKYALKELLEGIETDEILNLTICEPAMGSAAFINEAIDQLSEAYLTRKQKETGIVISQESYIIEKQRVKMHIADHNIYGIDLNPIAVELAEVSLWLNTIYKGAHVPWFGLQLKYGNSLIGARRQYFLRSQVLKSSKNSYLKAVPKRYDWQGRAAANRIYHFLLPDAEMASYKNKVIKDLEPEKINMIEAWGKRFATQLTDSEADKLIEISKSVDILWKMWAGKLRSLREELTDEVSVFGRDAKDSIIDFNFKDNAYRKELTSYGQESSSTYQRLKLAMDYWCALWFWPIDKANQLPSREQFIKDMEEILIGKRTNLPDGLGQLSLFDKTDSDHPEGILLETGLVNINQLKAHYPHLHTVQEIANTYHFLHWELEYADIFEDRGGFDLILGNPPWLKVEWEEKGVLSDYDPKFIIKNITASETVKRREAALQNSQAKKAYLQEFVASVGTKSYLNALQNYPVLKGVQTNLYKCFLPQAWMIGSPKGYSGFLHPEGVYDDPNGGKLRNEAYHRLMYHFQFQNQKILFPIAHRAKYSINIYKTFNEFKIEFYHISNLFLPKTIDDSFLHIGNDRVNGIKNIGAWNIQGHKDRILYITEKELTLFAILYDEEGTSYSEARLPSLHAKHLISVLEKFAAQPKKLGDLKEEYISTEMWHETNAEKDGYIKKETGFPKDSEHLIVSGPHLYVATPINKTPRKICTEKGHYDCIDLTNIPEDYLPRTKYVPVADILPDGSEDLRRYHENIPRVPWKEPGEVLGKKVTEYYRLCFRAMLSQSGERTLISALMNPYSAHINGVQSTCFKKNNDLLIASSLTTSLVSDFYLKSTGNANLHSLWLNIPYIERLNHQLRSRILKLNCLTKRYSSLWQESFDPAFIEASWTKTDPRLDNNHFSNLTPDWTWDTPLRSDYTRRQALVEIDVLVAQAMGLTLEELQTIYRIQFPVMQQYEKDTFFDQKGRIVFTVSKGLSGVGFPRKKNPHAGIDIGWEDICDMTSGTVSRTIIDDTLPGGPVEREIVYYAPFDRCDRESDYATAWAEFERRELL
ncbi:MAG: class I SAM-dependent DNA methyltransferase [Sphaerochaeta sp.]|nr:class I SAM-dependent DNA methyltransferase [Sphaerochaeta sp.]